MGDLSGSTEPLKGKDVEKEGSNAGDDVEKQKPKTVSRALFDDQCFLKALTPTKPTYIYLIISLHVPLLPKVWVKIYITKEMLISSSPSSSIYGGVV